VNRAALLPSDFAGGPFLQITARALIGKQVAADGSIPPLLKKPSRRKTSPLEPLDKLANFKMDRDRMSHPRRLSSVTLHWFQSLTCELLMAMPLHVESSQEFLEEFVKWWGP
jgi:hypothetical protein